MLPIIPETHAAGKRRIWASPVSDMPFGTDAILPSLTNSTGVTVISCLKQDLLQPDGISLRVFASAITVEIGAL
jgi:hypothetical protein